MFSIGQAESSKPLFPVRQQTYKTDDLPDKDQLAEDFISNLMSGRRSGAKKDSRRGASLSGTEGNVYSLLLSDITSIANGERSSTVLEYDASAVYPKTEYTKDDLGVDSILDEEMQFTQAAIDAIDKIIVFNLDSVWRIQRFYLNQNDYRRKTGTSNRYTFNLDVL